MDKIKIVFGQKKKRKFFQNFFSGFTKYCMNHYLYLFIFKLSQFRFKQNGVMIWVDEFYFSYDL
jgi:hypothetical protein